MIDENVSGLLQSKKFKAAIVAVIMGIGAKLGLNFDPATIAVIISPVIAYIVGQAVADKGKEAARIEKQAAEITANAAKSVAHIEAGAVVQAAKEAGPVAPQVTESVPM